MRQHRRASRLRPVVGRVEQAAKHGAEPHHVEVAAADDAGTDDARFAKADHREIDGGELADGGQRLGAGANVPNLRDGELGVVDPDAGRALTQIDEVLFVLVDQRPEQHPADDAEDGGVGANTQRQRQDDRDGEALDAGQRPGGELEVGDEAHTVRRVASSRSTRVITPGSDTILAVALSL